MALVVPHDVLDAEWRPSEADQEVDDRYRRAPAYRPVASQDSVEQAATLLRKARRPLIVAGGGVHASRATTELAALAERLDAVVVTSFSGKGAVDETAPYAAGVLNPLGTTASLELARRADVVLWCGCKVGQNTSHNWSLPLAHQATIQLDVDPGELGRTFRPAVALNGDARATLAGLLALLRRRGRAECVQRPGDRLVSHIGRLTRHPWCPDLPDREGCARRSRRRGGIPATARGGRRSRTGRGRTSSVGARQGAAPWPGR